MKAHMERVIGSQVLTYEEFLTYLAEIEACQNSRPLVLVSSDSKDCTAITPAPIIGTSLKGVPEPNLCNKRISLCDRWKLLQ
ncbi:integrase catalytic domain-containing protein [Trichonephila clavipes]|nr:integrase catalytic domain-containing protein [Trichonephila clavipes]